MSARRSGPLVSAREWRLFWIIALSLAVISGGVTALSTLFGRPEEPKNVLPSQSPFKSEASDTILRKILLTDLDLPAPGGQWLGKTWLYSRDGGNRSWSPEEIEPFWVPVERLPLLSLPQKNQQAIDDLFKAVP